jgi:hypothetical protein
MRTRHTFLVLGVVFGMMLALGQVASAAPSTTLDIVFDGYCDGMHINVPSLGLGTAGTLDGDHTGCVTGGFEGTTSSSPKAFHITTTYGGLVLPLEHWQVNANHTWAVYGISGDLETFINSGTWSPGTPHADRGTAAGLALSRSSARPTVALDIVFDGYCDGMHLNLPSAGLGTPGTVDGDHTGCISGGFVGTSSGRPKGAHISTDYGGSHPELLHFLINANGTWTIYSISGDLQTFINAGTWSPGTPKGDGRPAAG